ncbi:MAG: hypothetical protein QOF03_1059 [Alphaproteobacteria bacterium]|jgi:hypothetical protein|nr:hypothetical protein [Alphaproteobacteria bacterium]
MATHCGGAFTKLPRLVANCLLTKASTTGLPLARNLHARRPAASSCAFCDDGMPQRIMQSARMPPLLATTGASAVMLGRREAASPESKKTGNPDVLDSGLAPEPVIGPDPLGAPRNDVLEFFGRPLSRVAGRDA